MAIIDTYVDICNIYQHVLPIEIFNLGFIKSLLQLKCCFLSYLLIQSHLKASIFYAHTYIRINVHCITIYVRVKCATSVCGYESF